jgi:hypothetical protein
MRAEILTRVLVFAWTLFGGICVVALVVGSLMLIAVGEATFILSVNPPFRGGFGPVEPV